MCSVEELKAILKGFDLDSDGFITEEEVRASIIKEQGEDYQLSQKELEFFMIVGSFADADGKVPIKEVVGKYSLLNIFVQSNKCTIVQILDILFSRFLPHYGIFGDLQGESSRSVGKTVQVFLIRMETESFLKLKPRQVFQALVVRRVTWKMSLKN